MADRRGAQFDDFVRMRSTALLRFAFLLGAWLPVRGDAAFLPPATTAVEARRTGRRPVVVRIA